MAIPRLSGHQRLALRTFLQQGTITEPDARTVKSLFRRGLLKRNRLGTVLLTNKGELTL